MRFFVSVGSFALLMFAATDVYCKTFSKSGESSWENSGSLDGETESFASDSEKSRKKRQKPKEKRPIPTLFIDVPEPEHDLEVRRNIQVVVDRVAIPLEDSESDEEDDFIPAPLVPDSAGFSKPTFEQLVPKRQYEKYTPNKYLEAWDRVPLAFKNIIFSNLIVCVGLYFLIINFSYAKDLIRAALVELTAKAMEKSNIENVMNDIGHLLRLKEEEMTIENIKRVASEINKETQLASMLIRHKWTALARALVGDRLVDGILKLQKTKFTLFKIAIQQNIEATQLLLLSGQFLSLFNLMETKFKELEEKQQMEEIEMGKDFFIHKHRMNLFKTLKFLQELDDAKFSKLREELKNLEKKRRKNIRLSIDAQILTGRQKTAHNIITHKDAVLFSIKTHQGICLKEAKLLEENLAEAVNASSMEDKTIALTNAEKRTTYLELAQRELLTKVALLQELNDGSLVEVITHLRTIEPERQIEEIKLMDMGTIKKLNSLLKDSTNWGL